jgi:hypothetical protein
MQRSAEVTDEGSLYVGELVHCKAIGAITAAVARGEITATDAADVSRLVETYVRAIEASDLDKRLKTLEEAMRCERAR